MFFRLYSENSITTELCYKWQYGPVHVACDRTVHAKITKPDACLSKSLHSLKLCVWIGLTSEFVLRPFFFEESINSDAYLRMLQMHVRPQLSRRQLSSIIFMQDGAPPHFATRVRDYICETFSQEGVISRGCAHPWPPRSPNLNPLDYWFWGWLKAKVYHTDKPRSLLQLRDKITDICNAIVPEELEAGVDHIVHRLQLTIDSDGDHFEHRL